MQDKILTISIAAYNAHEYIDRCLSSLIGIKNFNKLDIIIIDDGSKDDTYNLAKVYEDKYPDCIQLIKKENGGWGSTVNISLKHAKGKYFKILDVDDFFKKENIDEFVNFLEAKDSDVVISPFEYYYVKKNKYILEQNINYQMHALTFKTKMLQENNISITEKCFYTDVEISLKGVKYAKTFDSFDKTVYIYVIGMEEQSISDTSFKKHINNHRTVLDNLITNDYNEVMSSSKYNERIRIAFTNRLKEMIEKHYSILFKFDINADTKNKILEFDNYLKKASNILYNLVGLKRIKLFRMNNNSYYIIAPLLKLRTSVYNALLNS